MPKQKQPITPAYLRAQTITKLRREIAANEARIVTIQAACARDGHYDATSGKCIGCDAAIERAPSALPTTYSTHPKVCEHCDSRSIDYVVQLTDRADDSFRLSVACTLCAKAPLPSGYERSITLLRVQPCATCGDQRGSEDCDCD